MSVKAGEAYIEITAQDKTKKDANSVLVSLKKIEAQAKKKVDVQLGGLQKASLLVTGLASSISLVKSAVTSAVAPFTQLAGELDATQKQAERLGTTSKELYTIKLAGDLAGVSIAGLEKNLDILKLFKLQNSLH